MIRIHLDILVVDLLFLEDGPNALYEGAEPACVEGDWLRFLMGLEVCQRQMVHSGLVSGVYVDNGFRRTSGHRVKVCVRVGTILLLCHLAAKAGIVL